MDAGELAIQFRIIPYLATNASMLLLALACWRWKGVGRFLFVLLFLAAAGVNAWTVIHSPRDYLDFADTAWWEFYRAFILGSFSRHIALIVGVIAAAQLGIGVLLMGRGRAVRAGLAGGMAFFLAIAPLGFGSAFPSTLIACAAAALLWKGAFSRCLLWPA